MTDMYDEPKVSEVNLNPYPHEERGKARGRAADPVKFIQSIEQRARERQIATETVRLLRQDVIDCYRREGVNHFENCKEVTTRYYNVVSKPDNGQIHPKWSDGRKVEY